MMTLTESMYVTYAFDPHRLLSHNAIYFSAVKLEMIAAEILAFLLQNQSDSNLMIVISHERTTPIIGGGGVISIL